MIFATGEEIRKSGKIDYEATQVIDTGTERGRGLFARKTIARGTIVASYGGRSENSENLNSFSAFRYAYNRNNIIDGEPQLKESMGHLGNFVNDAHGPARISSGNNARYSSGNINLNGKRIPTVWIVTTRTIYAGQEICVYYGKSYWKK